MLKSYIKDIGKKKVSYSIVKAIESRRLRAPPKANKGRKDNSNTTKDRGNRAKRLAL
jgi:hypothetical protein